LLFIYSYNFVIMSKELEATAEPFRLSKEQKKILEERLAQYRANPKEGSKWNELKARLQKELPLSSKNKKRI